MRSLQGDESLYGDAGCSVLSEEIRNRVKLSAVLSNASKFIADRMGQETSFQVQCKH